eukprot:scaffold22060_cov68-Phaeocystis_antarctica.AAC.8
MAAAVGLGGGWPGVKRRAPPRVVRASRCGFVWGDAPTLRPMAVLSSHDVVASLATRCSGAASRSVGLSASLVGELVGECAEGERQGLQRRERVAVVEDVVLLGRLAELQHDGAGRLGRDDLEVLDGGLGDAAVKVEGVAAGERVGRGLFVGEEDEVLAAQLVTPRQARQGLLLRRGRTHARLPPCVVELRQRDPQPPRRGGADDVLLRREVSELAPRPVGGQPLCGALAPPRRVEALLQLGRVGTAVVEHPLGADEVRAQLAHVVGPLVEVLGVARDEEGVPLAQHALAPPRRQHEDVAVVPLQVHAVDGPQAEGALLSLDEALHHRSPALSGLQQPLRRDGHGVRVAGTRPGREQHGRACRLTQALLLQPLLRSLQLLLGLLHLRHHIPLL